MPIARPEDPGPELHAIWEAATGLRIPYTLQTGFRWEAWQHAIRQGLANSDWREVTPGEVLREVIRYRRAKTRDNPRILMAWCRLSKITGHPEECLEDYAYARHEQRNRTDRTEGTDQARVLRATGRVTDAEQRQTTAPARTAGEVLRRDPAAAARALREFLELKEKLKAES